jgi:DNA-binding transcriptional LysR family regulator
MVDIHMVNIARLDLNLLIALEALLEEASVGRAAHRVALSQPAMSHSLNRLRALLGDPLLVRVGARMRLTTRGEALRHPVKEVLARARDLLVTAHFDPTSSTRTFRLFVSDYAADLLLPPLVRELQAKAPLVSIRAHNTSGIGAIDSAQLASAVDLAVSCVPERFKGFYQQRLFTDRDALAVRRGQPLIKRRLSPEVFLEAGHVAVVGPEFAADPVDDWLRKEGRSRNVVLTVPHYLQALQVVGESDLMAVIPERLVRAHADALGLEVMAVPLDVGTFDEYQLHPVTSHADPGSVWLREVLQGVAKSLGPLSQ